MKYMGGKFKLASKFLPIILKGRKEGQIFVEPFCGGCNVTVNVDGPRIANDANKYVVSMWKALQKGWVPPEYVSFGDYIKIKNNPVGYAPELVGFVGIASAFSAKFFGTYARGSRGITKLNNLQALKQVGKNQNINFTAMSKRSVLKSVELIQGVKFTNHDYQRLIIPPGSIVYCDPPYLGTCGYDKDTGYKFDHLEFWAWVRNLSMYNFVYVSEYIAPKDFKSVWSMNRTEKVSSTKKGDVKMERLFVWKNGMAAHRGS